MWCEHDVWKGCERVAWWKWLLRDNVQCGSCWAVMLLTQSCYQRIFIDDRAYNNSIDIIALNQPRAHRVWNWNCIEFLVLSLSGQHQCGKTTGHFCARKRTHHEPC